MALIFKSSAEKTELPVKSPKSGHTKAKDLTFVDLSKPGRIRTGHMMTLFSVSHSTLYKRMHTGTIPKPDGKDGLRPFWRTETVAIALAE